MELGRQYITGNSIRIVPRKTRYKRREPSEKPILPILADIIARSPTGDMTYLRDRIRAAVYGKRI